MFVTNHAQELYRAIESLGGGAIREQVLRTRAGCISHGTFSAARRELCEAGLIAIDRVARKPHYRLIAPERAAEVLAASAAIYGQGEEAVLAAKAEARATQAEIPPPQRKSPPLHVALMQKISEDSLDKKDMVRITDSAWELVPIAIFHEELPHIAGHFADLADWLEALTEEFGDFDLDEGTTTRTYILYVPARRHEDHYEVWPMPDGLMVL